MKLITRIKHDIRRTKQLTGKQRRLFIWDYYKLPIISVLIIVALGVTVLLSLGRQRASLYIVMINANTEADSSIFGSLMHQGGAGLDEEKISVEPGYTLNYDNSTETDAQTVHVLAVRFGIGDLDVFAADSTIFDSYAKKDAFVDLGLFIPKELLQANETNLYRSINQDGQEIICGIWLREGSPLHQVGYYHGDVLIGAAALAENLDFAVLLIHQLLISTTPSF